MNKFFCDEAVGTVHWHGLLTSLFGDQYKGKPFGRLFDSKGTASVWYHILVAAYDFGDIFCYFVEDEDVSTYCEEECVELDSVFWSGGYLDLFRMQSALPMMIYMHGRSM